MDDTTEKTKKPRTRRTTERGEEAKSGGGEAKRRPPRVKLEQQSEAGKGEKPRRRVEEGVPKESKRKTAVAASRQEAVVEKAARLVKARESVASDSYSHDSYSSSDHSATPAREDSWSSSGEHYHPYEYWDDDGRGQKAEGRNVRGRRQRDRSRSGGHGKGGRPTSRVDSRRNAHTCAWRSENRRDAFNKRQSGRSPKDKRRRIPWTSDSDSSEGEGKASMPTRYRSQREGGKGNNRGKGRNPPPPRPPTPPPPPPRRPRQDSSRSRSGGDEESARCDPPTPPPPQRPRQDPSRSRSGGDEGGYYARKTSINVTLAHFVVTTDATVDDFEWLFSKTPANLVVVSYDLWEEESHEISKKVRRAVGRLNKVKKVWDSLRMPYGSIFAKSSRISSISEKLIIGGDGPHRFICCDFDIRESRLSASGNVTLGFFASAKRAGPHEQSWMSMVCSAVAESKVHYICGVFWRKKDEIETLFKQLGACESGVFFQPWWTHDRHDKFDAHEMAALGARFGVVPQNASYIVVYPAYLVVLGTRADEVTRPELWRQPGWQDELFPHGSGIQRGLKDLSVVPQLPEHIAPGGITRAFLPLIQKQAPPQKWIKGVHQLLLWVGYSRPSRRCAKAREAWWNRHWSRW